MPRTFSACSINVAGFEIVGVATLRPNAHPTLDDDPAEVTAEPVLNYSDPVRVLSHASCWLWTDRSRPVGALAIEYHPRGEADGYWTFEGVTLLRGEVRLRQRSREWTLRDDTGVTTELASAPAPEAAAKKPQAMRSRP